MVAIFELPSNLFNKNLAAYQLQFGESVPVTSDGMWEEWRFEILLDVKTFYSFPNSWTWKGASYQ